MNTQSTLSTLALLGVSLSLAGCVAADNSIAITGLVMGEGTASEDGVFCEFDADNTENLTAERLIMDISALRDFGHAPFVGTTHPTGTLVGVLGVGNLLQSSASGSSLSKTENDIYIKEVLIDWTIDGDSQYKPGKASSAANPCQGTGIRLSNERVPAGVISQPMTVELLTDKVPTIGTTDELSCLAGALAGVSGDTSIPTEFIVEIQARGETTAGVNVESPVLQIPVLVCDGCAEKFGGVLNFNGAPSGATPQCLIGM